MSISHRKKSAKAKGNEGEKTVHRLLSVAFLKNQATIFSNVLLKGKFGSAQLDHVIITQKAIYVIETKNYSGLIFGKVDDREWVVAYGRRTKRFYNPLWQNERHVQVLRALVLNEATREYSVVSVVVFSDRATLRLEEGTTAHHRVVAMSRLVGTIQEVESSLPECDKEQYKAIVATIKRVKKPATHNALSEHIRFANKARKNQKRISSPFSI